MAGEGGRVSKPNAVRRGVTRHQALHPVLFARPVGLRAADSSQLLPDSSHGAPDSSLLSPDSSLCGSAALCGSHAAV
jgi:hypothetical protein